MFKWFTCSGLACADFSFSLKLSDPSKLYLRFIRILYSFPSLFPAYQIYIDVEENESQYWYNSRDEEPGEEGVVFSVVLVPPQLWQLHPGLLLYSDQHRLVDAGVIGGEPDDGPLVSPNESISWLNYFSGDNLNSYFRFTGFTALLCSDCIMLEYSERAEEDAI